MNSNNNILLNIINNSIDIIDTNNLTINSRVELDSSNVYKDLKVDILVHQALSYVLSGNDIPKEMKDVLNYYGIVDHFYPVLDNDLDCSDAEPEGGILSEGIEKVQRLPEDSGGATRQGRSPTQEAKARTNIMQEAIAKRAKGNIRTKLPGRSTR